MSEFKKIAILGPLGSYSELAARHYIAEQNWQAEIIPCPNIIKAFSAVGQNCDLAIIPIENMIEGYIPLSLDLLAESRHPITDEIIIPVNFSFVANCADLADVQQIYVQFVTEGQCRNFLTELQERSPDCRLITTESNSASWEEVCRHRRGEGAIVPSHLLGKDSFGLSLARVSDREGNRTRFLVVSAKPNPAPLHGECRTSIVIRELADAPGALYAIIGAFAQRKINLSCIMSRPNKLELGRYFFFIDIDAAYPGHPGLAEALAEIAQHNEVKILGSYPVARPALSD